jgi:hypothetical protein
MTSDNQVSSMLLLILIGLAIYFLLNPYEGFINKISDKNTENFEEGDDNFTDADITGDVADFNENDFNQASEESDIDQNFDLSNLINNNVQSSIPVPQFQENVISEYDNGNYQQISQPQQQLIPNDSMPIIESQPIVQQQMQVSTKPVSQQQKRPIKQTSPVQYIQSSENTQVNKPTLFEPKLTTPQVQNIQAKVQNIQPQVQQLKQQINNIKSAEAPVDKSKININFDPNDDSFDLYGTELNNAFANPLPAGVNPDIVDFKKTNNDNYNAKDFLPKQINDEWFETDFSLAKYQLNDDKLINTERYIIGINTVGESLKNASYDIRGTIPNPKFIVSPWNNSTYEPDFNLKPLC